MIGDAYVFAYARLWDEDEAMMQARERALARRRTPNFSASPLDPGEARAIRASLPLAFNFGEAPYGRVEVDGEFVAHSTVCPHWLGPLNEAPVILGEVCCPRHGYRFDVASGKCAVHPALRLNRVPEIWSIDDRVVVAWPADTTR